MVQDPASTEQRPPKAPTDRALSRQMKPVGSVRSGLGEGPVWDDRRGCLWYVDITAQLLHSLTPHSGRAQAWRFDRPVGALALTEGDALVLAVRDGFAWFEPATGACALLQRVPLAQPDDRMNDGACDPLGRFWAGTLSAAGTGTAGLYCLDTSGRLCRHLEHVTISNGIDWSPDSTVMYYVDTPTRRIDRFAFDRDSGALSDRDTFVDLATAEGVPDGICVDVEGGVWVAMWGGGCLHRYTAAGRRDQVVEVPAAHPTKMVFGGADYRDMFVTSAREPLPVDSRATFPDAGAVFVSRVDVPGRPPRRFGCCVAPRPSESGPVDGLTRHVRVY